MKIIFFFQKKMINCKKQRTIDYFNKKIKEIELKNEKGSLKLNFLLGDSLLERMSKFNDWFNFGCGGDTSDNLLCRVQELHNRGNKLGDCLILIGINDLSYKLVGKSNTQKEKGYLNIINNIKNIINLIEGKIYLVLLLNVNPEPEENEFNTLEEIRKKNIDINDMVPKLNKLIIDTFSGENIVIIKPPYLDNKSYFIDPVHFSGKGYEVLIKTIIDHIK